MSPSIETILKSTEKQSIDTRRIRFVLSREGAREMARKHPVGKSGVWFRPGKTELRIAQNVPARLAPQEKDTILMTTDRTAKMQRERGPAYLKVNTSAPLFVACKVDRIKRV